MKNGLITALAEPECTELRNEATQAEAEPGQRSRESILEDAYLLWSRRRLLGKALVAGLLAGFALAVIIPSRYESTVQLMPPDNQTASGLAAMAALAAKSSTGFGMMAGDLLGVRSSGALFVGILHSRTVQDRLIDRFRLKSVYNVKLNEDARIELARNTGASEDRKSGIITLTVNDRDRQRAREMAAAYIEELNRLVAELSTSAARRERIFLEERLVAVKQDLDHASHELSEFSSKNVTLDVKEQARAMVEATATLQGELIAAQSQRQALETVYTPNNVRVRAAEARVVELQKQLEKLGGKEDGALSVSGEPLYPSLRKLPLLGEKYADLYRKATIEEAVFETLTQQCELAKVQEAKETPSVKILDEASLPERRDFPPRTFITLLGGFMASIAASVWIVAEQRWKRIAEGDRRKQFAIEVLGDMKSVMPWATPNGSRWQAASHKVWIRLVKREDRPAEKAK